MQEKQVLYFAQGGPERSEATLRAARARAPELKPEALVVATTSGATALLAAQVFQGLELRILAVPFQKPKWDQYGPPQPELVERCQRLGVEFLPESPLVRFFDQDRPDVANAWRVLSQGFKVALQVATMCVDTGLLPDRARVLAVGGTGEGADTALCLRARRYEALLKSKVLEIIALPQE